MDAITKTSRRESQRRVQSGVTELNRHGLVFTRNSSYCCSAS